MGGANSFLLEDMLAVLVTIGRSSGIVAMLWLVVVVVQRMFLPFVVGGHWALLFIIRRSNTKGGVNETSKQNASRKPADAIVTRWHRA
jgi:hypothetical protein